MFARKGVGVLFVVVGLATLLTVGWPVAVGIFLVVWGNDLCRGRTCFDGGECS